MRSQSKAPVAVIVHTLNEEMNLEYCLSALDWAQDVFVVDSGSRDRTLEIARRHTPHVYERQGTRGTLVELRNWALENLPFQTEWVFIVDADEVVLPDLAQEVARIVSNPPSHIDGYWLRFKNIFLGRWIKHASLYPTWTLRLFRHRLVRYEPRKVNSHPMVSPGREGYLDGHLLHEDHAGLSAFISRIPDFSRLEALEYFRLRSDAAGGTPTLRDTLKSSAKRRRWLKVFAVRLPLALRPPILFFYLYILRGGFLDGYQGFAYCGMKTVQEWFINLHLWNMRRNGLGPHS